MEISKFMVGVLTIAMGLLAAGQLAPATIELAKNAVQATQHHTEFKLGQWNRKLGK
jgi:hypothetical protein